MLPRRQAAEMGPVSSSTLLRNTASIRKTDFLTFCTFLYLCVSCYHQGTAVTFITEEQARYSGEIIKALELSGTKVPPSLLKLWEKFKEDQQAVSGFLIRTRNYHSKTLIVLVSLL